MSTSRKRKPAPKTKTRTRRQPDPIEEAAQNAVEEVENPLDFEFGSPEERDQALASHATDELSDDQIDEKDVFFDGIQRARERNTTVKFRIYRDGEMLTMVQGSYSWENLQQKWGPGYYKVVAVNRDNQIMCAQTQQLAAPEGWNQPIQRSQTIEAPTAVASSMEMLEIMKEGSREAKAEAAAQGNSLAQVMATMMSAITQSSTNMMTMINTMNQQTQTLIMQQQKESREAAERAQEREAQRAEREFKLQLEMFKTMSDGKSKGMDGVELYKEIRDAEKRGQDQTKTWFDLIEKKSTQLAEQKAELMNVGGGEEESLTKSVVKGFIPLLTQVLAAQGQHQQPNQPVLPPAPVRREPTPEEAARIHNARMQREQKLRARQKSGEANDSGTPNVGRTINNAEKTVRGLPGEPQLIENPKAGPDFIRLKEQLFEKAAPLIGEALMKQQGASVSAEQVLKHLEKDGYERQTVCKAFELDELYRLAGAVGLPPEVQPWLKEFHAALTGFAISPTIISSETAKTDAPKRSTNRVAPIRTAEPIPAR